MCHAGHGHVELQPTEAIEAKVVFVDNGRYVWETGPNRRIDLPELIKNITTGTPPAISAPPPAKVAGGTASASASGAVVAPAVTSSSGGVAALSGGTAACKVVGADTYVTCAYGVPETPVIVVPELEPVFDAQPSVTQPAPTTPSLAPEAATMQAPTEPEPTTPAAPATVTVGAQSVGPEVPVAPPAKRRGLKMVKSNVVVLKTASAGTKAEEPAVVDQVSLRVYWGMCVCLCHNLTYLCYRSDVRSFRRSACLDVCVYVCACVISDIVLKGALSVVGV